MRGIKVPVHNHSSRGSRQERELLPLHTQKKEKMIKNIKKETVEEIRAFLKFISETYVFDQMAITVANRLRREIK